MSETTVSLAFPNGQPRCQARKRDGKQCNHYTMSYAGTGAHERFCGQHAQQQDRIAAGAKTTRRYFIHFTGSAEMPASPRERSLPDYFDTADECRKAIRDSGWQDIATCEAADF